MTRTFVFNFDEHKSSLFIIGADIMFIIYVFAEHIYLNHKMKKEFNIRLNNNFNRLSNWQESNGGKE